MACLPPPSPLKLLASPLVLRLRKKHNVTRIGLRCKRKFHAQPKFYEDSRKPLILKGLQKEVSTKPTKNGQNRQESSHCRQAFTGLRVAQGNNDIQPYEVLVFESSTQDNSLLGLRPLQDYSKIFLIFCDGQYNFYF